MRDRSYIYKQKYNTLISKTRSQFISRLKAIKIYKGFSTYFPTKNQDFFKTFLLLSLSTIYYLLTFIIWYTLKTSSYIKVYVFT